MASLSYAGVNLGIPIEPFGSWAASNFPVTMPETRDMVPKVMIGRPHLGQRLRPPMPPPRLGTLWWPTGASRWAVGYYAVTDNLLDQIRTRVYTNNGYRIQTLRFDDDVNPVMSADMWMLPPRQITADGLLNPIYLLELVDDRFHWWCKAGQTSITEGLTTWAQLYNQIGTSLGVPLQADPVHPHYLTPSRAFASDFDFLPLLLDAAAWSCGQRLVRQLDGKVEVLNATTSRQRMKTEINRQRPTMAGGLYSLGV